MEMRELYHKECQIKVYFCSDNLYNIDENKRERMIRDGNSKRENHLCVDYQKN